MSNIRLFFNESLYNNLTSRLDKSKSHYLSKVMRVGVGHNFSLFNHSGEWEAKVKEINKGVIEFSVIKKLRPASIQKEIWLAFAPIKLNYLNFMIQKATELGVTKFIPILTHRTIVRKLNEKRLNKIIIEASEQSNRFKPPKLDKLIKLDNFLRSNQNTNIIFADLNTNNSKVKVKNIDPLCILIGPEGDFSIEERANIFKLKNLTSVKINQNILRSETAAISTISIINYILNL